MKDIVGFLLTRQWRDTAEGLVLRYWLTSDVGPLLIEQKNQEGVFFVESEVSEKAKALIRHQFHRTKALSLKTFSIIISASGAIPVVVPAAVPATWVPCLFPK